MSRVEPRGAGCLQVALRGEVEMVRMRNEGREAEREGEREMRGEAKGDNPVIKASGSGEFGACVCVDM